MIALDELKKGLIAVLRKQYPKGYKFYGNEVIEGYEKPSFFTQLIPATMENATQHTTNNTMLFVITYFQKQKDEADNFRKITEIRKAFGLKVEVADRQINVEELDYQFVGEEGNILQIQVTINYIDDIKKEEEQHEAIGGVVTRMEVN